MKTPYLPALLAVLLPACLALSGRAATKPEPTGLVFALYFTAEPRTDPVKQLEELLAGEFRELAEVAPVSPVWKNTADFPPPDPASFRYVAHGLEPAAGEAMAKSPRVLGLLFSADTSRLLRANRLANALVAQLAETTGGSPWDDECRLIYSAAEWRKRRVEPWQGDIPDVRGQVNLHAYRDPELVRVITLGLRKFNLPDLVMTEVVPGSSTSAANLINATAQLLLEGARPEGARLVVDFAKVQQAAVRAYLQADPKEGSTGRVVVSFRNAPRDEGDPDNRLWLLDFPDSKAGTRSERQSLAFATLFGAEEKIAQARAGDPELQKASARARRDFFANEAAFRRGLQPSERLVVKKGFLIDGQTEFMWVEITRWNEASLDGLLLNDSMIDDKIRHGQRVTVSFDEVYDYIHYKPDGTEAGNETGKILERRQSR